MNTFGLILSGQCHWFWDGGIQQAHVLTPPGVGKADNLANVPIPIRLPILIPMKCKCKCKSSKYSTSARPHPPAWAKPII